jgi:predicted  nucleic acid-binding Zn-ribbon protein
MTEFNEHIGLVQTQNKARAYNKKVNELEQQVTDLQEQVKNLANHLKQMCVQADEDTPAAYRTEHFTSTLDDAYEYLKEKNLL